MDILNCISKYHKCSEKFSILIPFSEIEKDGGDGEEEEEGADELLNPDKKKKAPAEGYESGVTLLFKQAKASDFIMGDKAIHLLNNCHEIVLDEARYFMTSVFFDDFSAIPSKYLPKF